MNTRREALIARARAGLIPESDYVDAERRARMDRIGRVVKAYAKLVAGSSGNWDGLAIIDILADLRHYVDSKGLVFDRLDSAAAELYLAEADGEW